jgi:hypothetical protein
MFVIQQKRSRLLNIVKLLLFQLAVGGRQILLLLFIGVQEEGELAVRPGDFNVRGGRVHTQDRVRVLVGFVLVGRSRLAHLCLSTVPVRTLYAILVRDADTS